MEAGCENLEWRTESGKCIVITLRLSTDVLLESEITIDCAPSEMSLRLAQKMRWYLPLFWELVCLWTILFTEEFSQKFHLALDHFVYYWILQKNFLFPTPALVFDVPTHPHCCLRSLKLGLVEKIVSIERSALVNPHWGSVPSLLQRTNLVFHCCAGLTIVRIYRNHDTHWEDIILSWVILCNTHDISICAPLLFDGWHRQASECSELC